MRCTSRLALATAIIAGCGRLGYDETVGGTTDDAAAPSDSGDALPPDAGPPVPFPDGSACPDGYEMVSFAAGIRHACAVLVDGSLWCWGNNMNGRLGVPGAGSDPKSQVIVGGEHWVEVGAGEAFTCGRTFARRVYCWGANDSGQIGVDVGASTPTPVLVGGPYDELAVGDFHACARVGGAIDCWGQNGAGQAGADPTVMPTVPSPTRVTSPASFADIDAGRRFNCGLDGAGALFCWGDNGSGQLGAGDLVARSSPTEIAAGVAFARLGLASTHACAITGAGALYCWGDNSRGQLGFGDIVERAVPTEVGGSWRAVMGGVRHTCGIRTDGTLWCWGRGSDCQIGPASRSSYTPIAVDARTDWQDVWPAQESSFARPAGGTLWGFGYNVDQVLGTPSPGGGDVMEPASACIP